MNFQYHATNVWQWLGNVDMHMYAKCDKNISCGSRVINMFTNWYWTDGRSFSRKILDGFFTFKYYH